MGGAKNLLLIKETILYCLKQRNIIGVGGAMLYSKYVEKACYVRITIELR